MYQDMQFTSAEQLYQFRKSIALDKPAIAARVRTTEDAYEAMKIGREMQSDAEWSEEHGYAIMEEIIETKLHQVLLMRSTLQKFAGKHFAEAS